MMISLYTVKENLPCSQIISAQKGDKKWAGIPVQQEFNYNIKELQKQYQGPWQFGNFSRVYNCL